MRREFPGFGMVTAFLLIDFILVAPLTSFGETITAIVARCAQMHRCRFFRSMAIVAANARLRVSTAALFLSQGWIERSMALDTGFVLLRITFSGRRLGRFGCGWIMYQRLTVR